MFNRSKFTTIKGISEQRRLPLLGKIRLGIKVFSEKKQKEYPKETDYFVCPDEVKKKFEEEPKELEIMLPVEDYGIIFPQALIHYGSSKGMKCIGDGQDALRKDENNEMQPRECPCSLLDEKKCSRSAIFRFIIPKVSIGGVYQINTGSINSIIDINSGLDYVRALIGRISMIPLKLKRVPIETHHEGMKQTHYTLKVIFDGNVEFINQLRENTKRILIGQEAVALPAPTYENPELDKVDVIESNGITDEENENKDTPGKLQIEKLPEGIHPKVVADKIKTLLRQSGFLKKKNPEGKYYELVLIQHVNEKAKKYSDLTRKEIENLYYELAEAQGNPDTIVIPFE